MTEREVKMEKQYIAIDLKSFYASVECFLNPELRGKPVAVCGDPSSRHGIILAKNRRSYMAGEGEMSGADMRPRMLRSLR